jgi:hypothetical protein
MGLGRLDELLGVLLADQGGEVLGQGGLADADVAGEPEQIYRRRTSSSSQSKPHSVCV